MTVNRPSTALLTDRYEFTMVDAALRSGQADRRSVFEIFTRSLPPQRGFGVVAGTERAVQAIADFRFGDAELDWLRDIDAVSPPTLNYLANYSFTGDVWGFREGDLYLSESPVFTVEASFADAVVLETVLLSIFNHDSAVASAVARMVDAAAGRPVIDGGARRAHERAAVSAARAAYLAGATSTSNLEAGRRYGIPTVGTIGHAFVLAHSDERTAFESQHDLLGPNTTYLVDTYDIEVGIRTAVSVAGSTLGAIRIDSGNLADESKRARAVLDQLGANETSIIVSGDLDEWTIAELADSPVDGYLVGTNLITGSGHPTASMVYKLVAIEDDGGALQPVNKRSSGKATIGGRKVAFRCGEGGDQFRDLVVTENDTAIGDVAGPGRRLQVPLVRSGQPLPSPSLDNIKAWNAECLMALPASGRALDGLEPPTRIVDRS